MSSLTIPPLTLTVVEGDITDGTGVGGFPLAECGRVMLRAVREHAAHGTSLRDVRVVLFGRDAYEAFVNAIHGSH